jgi:hypothetical protein
MSMRAWGQLVAWGSAWLLGVGTLGAVLTTRLGGDTHLTGYWFVAWGLVGVATGIALRLRTRA